ncbi:GNAT family N-acetyltransferase [Myxacorys almedinensis]|uniref:GNAT family N-acetyltransferase n=1 Tax=Myxacorys almedinensis A TaxID=2690445 RepID=A0A8J7ZC54_9CYAN|nr:GNAT family N-acetyltransferase [Myxacorys almedinensis]NDJ19245.1 GNAT family N-acetyltransferase [Myxacorys almedinensis A]
MDCSHIQFRDSTQKLQTGSHRTSALNSELEIEQLQALFQVAAFWARDRAADDLEIAIANSSPVISAWNHDHLIGFARATSDGIYRATIWDVVVHPDYQGAGIGRKLVQTVLSHPQVCRVERVYLMTTNQQEFYQRIGFEQNATTTMVYFNQPIALPNPALSVEMECDIGS